MEKEYISGTGSPKDLLLNPTLSPAAKLIYSSYILGAIESKIDIEQLENVLGLSRGKRREALKELENLGITKLIRYRDKQTKKVTGTCWVFINNMRTVYQF